MRSHLIILLVNQWFILCACYQDRDRCPFQSQWKTRADWFCNGGSVGKYTCLLNGIQNKYEESCSYDHNVLDAGEQYIISHNLHGVKCRNEEKFQPFPLRSNASSECILKKSKCSEPGQVVFNNGSTKEDRSCRCDFENGFVFLSTPNHPCKCLPSQEDCSCFTKECPFEFKLTPDYICVHQKNRSYKSVCPDLGPRLKFEAVQLPAKRNTEYSVRRVVEKVPFLYIKIRLKAPSIFRATGDNGVIRLEWTKPEETKWKIDKYILEESIDSLNTEITKEISSDKLEYEIDNVQEYATYRWKLYACSNSFRSNAIDAMYSTKHTFQFGIILNELCNQDDEFRMVIEKIKLAFKTSDKISGNYKIEDTQIRLGSIIVVLTFTTEDFYDEKILRNTFENAAKSGVFGELKDSDTNFWFKPLNNPQPPRSVISTNVNNVVTVSWKEPKRTFFRTENFIIQRTTDNWETVEEHQVQPNQNSFSIEDVPPTTIIRFKIYTEICNSIRSLPSDEVFTHVIGKESSMKNKEYENAQVQVGKDGFSTSSFCISDKLNVHEALLLQSERLILSERYVKRLLTCTLTEKHLQNITLQGYPCNISPIHESNVAVSLKRKKQMFEYFEIAIVDVQNLCVISSIAEFPCFNNLYCCPITYSQNKLFVHANFGEIETMDISGNIRKKIDLSSRAIAFSDLSYRKLSNDICGISLDKKNIISVEYDGSCKTLYNFSEKGKLERQLAVDNKDNFLVFTSHNYTPDYKVHTISPDGNYQRELLSAKIHPNEDDEPTTQYYASCFCIQNSLRTIVIVKGKVVYVYKYIKGDEAIL